MDAFSIQSIHCYPLLIFLHPIAPLDLAEQDYCKYLWPLPENHRGIDMYRGHDLISTDYDEVLTPPAYHTV